MQRWTYLVAQYQGVPRRLGRPSFPIDLREVYSESIKKNEMSKESSELKKKKDIEKSKRCDRRDFRKSRQLKNIY